MNRFKKNVEVNLFYGGAGGVVNTPQNILHTKKSLNPPKNPIKRTQQDKKIAIKAKQTTI